MKTIKERLNVFVEKQGLTGRSFSSSIGKSVSYLGMMKDNISSDIILKIHEVYPQLNMAWLLFGEGEMLIDNSKAPQHEHIIPVSDSTSTDMSIATADVSGYDACANVDVFGQSEFLRIRRRCEKLTDSNLRLTDKIIELTDYIISLHNSHEM
jgi:hypothetical protein